MDFKKLLKGVNCSCGERHTCSIKRVYIEPDACVHLGELLRRQKNILIVADQNTYAAAGKQTLASLKDKNVTEIIFSGSELLVPNERAISAVESKLKGINVIIGVGSGVIQDLCKYTSFKNHIPYIIVATAPSMDGYASDVAAMIIGGMKVSYKAGLPLAIIADTKVIKNAPLEMLQSGYGDIIGKFSALNDWKLSHVVCGEYYCDYTLAELKELDAGNGEKIPTLRELFELVKDHPTLTLDLEFKEYPVGAREETAFLTADKILAVVEEYNFAERSVINSFNQKLNEYIYKKYDGRYKQHLFFPERFMQMEGCELPLYSFGYCACVFGAELSVEEINEFHEKTGIRVWGPASLKDEESIDMAIGFGVELITCNNPDEVLEILRKKGLHK